MQNANSEHRWTTWVVIGTAIAGCAFVLIAHAASLELEIVSGGLQLLGIALAGLGVNVVRVWLKRLASTAGEMRNAFSQLVQNIVDRLSSVQPEDRAHADQADGFPHVHAMRTPQSQMSTDALLDALVDELNALREDVQALSEQLTADMTAERTERQRQLQDQRAELEMEVRTATRQGWELIVAGLFWSAAGTALGIFR